MASNVPEKILVVLENLQARISNAKSEEDGDL